MGLGGQEAGSYLLSLKPSLPVPLHQEDSMKTRDEMFQVRPDGRLSNTPKSKSQLRRMEVQAGEGRRNVTRPSPKQPAILEGICLYCGDTFSNFDGKVVRCPKCDTPI